MLHSLDKTITKVAINMQEKYLQHDPQEQPQPSSEHSESKLLRKPAPRSAGLFIRNTLRNVLRKHFRRMLSRMMMRRACWRLVKSIRRRDMERAFLIIRNHTNQLALNNIHKFYERLPQLKIITSICNRIFNGPEKSALARIRAHSLRRKRVREFACKLQRHLSRGIFREAARVFWSIIIIDRSRLRQLQLGAEAIFRWVKSRKASSQRRWFAWLTDWVLVSSCNRDVEQWRNKKQKVLDSAENRKKMLAKLRQDLKNTKAEYEQEKAARYKVFQEHKKVTHANKAELAEFTREYEKEKKLEEVGFNEAKEELQEWQRLRNARNSILSRGKTPTELCFNAYNAISLEEEQIKNLERLLPDMKEDLASFKVTQNWLFLSNLQMGRLIDVYQKRQPYNYEAEYYELEYENRVVRETMRCFLRERYEAFVSRLRWGHSVKLPSELVQEKKPRQ